MLDPLIHHHYSTEFVLCREPAGPADSLLRDDIKQGSGCAVYAKAFKGRPANTTLHLWLGGLKDICREVCFHGYFCLSHPCEPAFPLRCLTCLAEAEHFHKNKSIAGDICRTVLQCSVLRNKSSKQLQQPNCFILQKIQMRKKLLNGAKRKDGEGERCF